MRRFAPGLAIVAGLFLASTAIAQNSDGRWQGHSPRFFSVPQTGWVKAEVLSDDPVSREVGEAINAQLRLRGYSQTPGGSYAVRFEVRGRGLSTPVVPIPGYSNTTQRLSIWPGPDQPNTIYVSLILYHQSTGEIVWQGEAACPGLQPDARNIVNAMVGPLMTNMGSDRRGRLDCRNL